ncbi:hypothetical protein BD779DRAFT_1678731 [Infundibulicybe gibba]|nr:hypothetical protein BD779DRAFT_1678731 [Infundibulicybe gibba]
MANLISDPRIDDTTASTVAKPEGVIQDKPLARMQVLGNQDVLREIFSHLASNSDDPANPKNKGVLFRAALTCKAFMEPALDSLWWSMSSFMPLLKLLQNFQPIEDGDNIFAFCNSFSVEDWARFDYHAKRVREFYYHTVQTQKINMCTLFHLGQCRSAVFPNLQRVTWTASLSPSIILLASSTLKYLDVKTNESGDNAIIMTLISVLSHRAQFLTDATFRGVLSKSCLALVPKISPLVTLTVPDLGASISMTFLRGLGAMGRLQNLRIDLQNPAITPIMLPGRIGFPELRTLHISGQFDMIHKFITGIVSDQMVSISVSSKQTIKPPSSKATPTKKGSASQRPTLLEHDSQEPPDILDLLGFIGNCWHHLARLDVDLPNMSPKYPDTTSFTLFQPLQNCHALTSISINGFMRPPSSDQDIVDIGCSCPGVQNLSIPFSPLPKGSSTDTSITRLQHTPTILGLRLLAQLCPHLTTLQLSLDTSGLPNATGEPLAHGLQVLSVGDSQAKDVYLVATHLDCLFPRLKTIQATDPVAPNGWGMVEKILRVCQAVRSAERKRIAVGKL